jgi:tripartite ATP-independent transporter DctM subunit
MNEIILVVFIGAIIFALGSGYPVAFALGGTSIVIAGIASLLGLTDITFVASIPSRIYGIVTNELLIAIPLFIFMGVVLEKSRIAEELLQTMGELFGTMRSGLAISVTLVGALLAAATGVVAASVITMGLLSLPAMLRAGYSKSFACGSICAAGTLGQIIPPSIVLLILADQISAAYQSAQMAMGNFAARAVSIVDLFVGAMVPSLFLVLGYIIWQIIFGLIWPDRAPPVKRDRSADESKSTQIWRVLRALVAPLALIVAVLGSILFGFATATEGAAVGAFGAMLLALAQRELTIERLRDVMLQTTQITAMIFAILIAAAMFALVFRGFGGDHIISEALTTLPGGMYGALFVVMLAIFLLGFIIDYMEICFIVIPIVSPPLFMMGVDPIWFAILVALNLQSSFLTPPFGFALFYLRGVAPPSVATIDIYRGVVPFIVIQMLVVLLVALVPTAATWLPQLFYR